MRRVDQLLLSFFPYFVLFCYQHITRLLTRSALRSMKSKLAVLTKTTEEVAALFEL